MQMAHPTVGVLIAEQGGIIIESEQSAEENASKTCSFMVSTSVLASRLLS